MLAIKLPILLALAAVFAQDMRSRSVYWFLFPLLALLFLAYRLSLQPLVHAWPPVAANLAFLLIQLMLVTAWFSLKRGAWVNLTAGLLGWGDVLFLCCAATLLSVLNFLLFYVSSLTVVLLAWAGWHGLTKGKPGHIPLAGLQALLLAAALLADWGQAGVDLTSDDWLYRLIT